MKIISKSLLLQQKRSNKFDFFYKFTLSDNAYSAKNLNLTLYVKKNKAYNSAKPVRFSRAQQIEHSESRRSSFNRRWSKATQTIRKALELIFPIRHLFSYIKNPFTTTSKDEAANKNYLYNYYKYKNNLKNVNYALQTIAYFATMTSAESQWVANQYAKPWLRPPSYSNQLTPRGKVMNFENDSQPSYVDSPKKGKAIAPSNARHNVNAYQLWEPIPEMHEDADTVMSNVAKGLNSQEFQAFVNLVGKEVANNYLRRMLDNKTKD